MMEMGSVDMRELVKLQENLKKLEDEAKRSSFVKQVRRNLLPDYLHMLLNVLQLEIILMSHCNSKA